MSDASGAWPNTLAFVLTFALALGGTLLLVPIASWIGLRLNIVSKYGGRRTTEGDRRRVPKLGGVALFGGFAVAAIAAQALPVARLDPYEAIRFAGLMLGAVVIFIVGVIDDRCELGARAQFFGQYAAAAIAILFQIFIEYVNNPITGAQTDRFPFILTVAISFAWLVGMMNTMNWLDGLDGLASGVTFIAAIVLFVNGAFRLDPPQISVSLLHLALAGCALGFALFNFYPARIFMGGGALLLGYLLGSLSIIGGAKMAAVLLVMGLPLLDSLWQVANRVRQRRNPFRGDRGHLHFRLLDRGLQQRTIVLGYYAFCAAFGVLALITTSQLYKLIALGVMGALALIGLAWTSRARIIDADQSSDGDSSG